MPPVNFVSNEGPKYLCCGGTDPLRHNASSYVNFSNNSWSGLRDGDSLRNNQTLTFHDRINSALLGVFLGFLSLLTIIMNLLVLYAVKKEKSLHTVGNLYIVSLSVADLIVGTTVMPLNLVYLLEDEWKLGRAVCQFWLIMDYVASTASIFSLFILCLDRYRSVRQPLKYLKYRTRGKASVMISGAWLLSMMWVIPILGWRSFTHVDLKPEEENKCDTDFRFVTWFKVITAVFNFYVPSVLMLWFYTYIYLAVRQHLRDRERIIHPTDSFGENDNGQNLQTSVKNDSKSPKRESEQTSLLDVICSGGNNENKLQASLNECHVTVPNPVSGVCDTNKVSDVQRYTSVLSNNYDPSQALPWAEEAIEDAKLDADNEITLRQAWQKFIDQSRHRIHSLRIHKEHKAAKQLGFIIAAFLLCWIPYFIAFMVMAFCRECVHHDLHMFTIWLGYINSTLNPFIYPLCNGNFKRVFKNILNIPL
uniref:Muscarinic acetylcholine receptor n=1 Tax=Neolamprologus brichardi TaxID=32507 RepID=A0A3Q4I4M8_NEOBR